MTAQQTGWVRDDAAVDAATIAISADSGESCVVGHRPALRGFAQSRINRGETGVFTWLAERKLFGAFKKAFYQRRGTCVGQGTARAVQDSWYHALSELGEVGRKAEVSVEAIYGGARVQIGGGRLSGDGAVGAWAAQYVHKYGAPARGIYGSYDLTKPREDLAVKWGARGNGVPSEVLEAGKRIKIRCFRCMTADDIFDAAWAGCGLAFCGGYTYGPKDRNGMSRMNAPANHCTEMLGAFITTSGDRGVGGQQSWGPGRPSGPSVLRYKGGSVD